MSSSYLIVGLGNPGPGYNNTRHNAGFRAIDLIASELGVTSFKTRFQGEYSLSRGFGSRIYLLKPMTYMNNSGISLRQFAMYFDIDPSKLLVIYDDIDTEAGTIRIRVKGSAGSHNGMKSVIRELGISEFPRIRIGIGKPEDGMPLDAYVVGSMLREDLDLLDKAAGMAKSAALDFVEHGINYSMNHYN